MRYLRQAVESPAATKFDGSDRGARMRSVESIRDGAGSVFP